MEDIKDEYKCNICNKIYSSYKTLWTHNKNKHKIIVNKRIPEVFICNQNVNNLEKIYKCKYCNNNYSTRQNKWKHEKKCQIIFNEKEQEKQINEIKIAEINKEIKLAEIELEKINTNKEKEVELAKINSNKEIELKKLEIRQENSLIKKEEKAHSNPTIKKINKMLRAQKELQNNININSNNNNTNTINNIQNNTVHNHFKIEGFGKENILDIISDKEKKLIINQGCESIEKLIEIINAGKYNQYKNIVITNKRENDAYIYDDKIDGFITSNKNWALTKLITNRLDNVEEIYNEFDEKNKLSNNTKKILSSFFIKMSNEDKLYIDENSNNKEYKNYLDFKVDKVNNLLFNNQDKIMNDITLAINKPEPINKSE
jgi:hypothetical protein